MADIRVGMLLYLVDTEDICANLLDESGTVRSYRLARFADVFPLIDRFYEAMEGGYSARATAAEYRRFAQEWGRQLLPPADDLRPFDVLILIPHYDLHGLPLHVVCPAGAEQPLALTHGVSYCASATLFARCVERNRARLADPTAWEYVVEAGQPTGAPQPPSRCLSVGADIKYDKHAQYKELAHLYARYFADALVDTLGARSLIKRPNPHAVDDWGSLCIVCHGYYDQTIPDGSGLLLDRILGGLAQRTLMLHGDIAYNFLDLPFRYLPVEIQPNVVDEDELLRIKDPFAAPSWTPGSPPGQPREAEIMTIGELKAQCSTGAELVALLGCSTGAGQLLAGDDHVSIAHQWLKVGAASVLASLWELEFDFIAQFLQLFLASWLERRQPKALAVRQALRDMLAARPQLAPETWGAIALLGDWL